MVEPVTDVAVDEATKVDLVKPPAAESTTETKKAAADIKRFHNILQSIHREFTMDVGGENLAMYDIAKEVFDKIEELN